jgi:hypothetical protein
MPNQWSAIGASSSDIFGAKQTDQSIRKRAAHSDGDNSRTLRRRPGTEGRCARLLDAGTSCRSHGVGGPAGTPAVYSPECRQSTGWLTFSHHYGRWCPIVNHNSEG